MLSMTHGHLAPGTLTKALLEVLVCDMWFTHKVAIPLVQESELCGETDLPLTMVLYLPSCVVSVIGLMS